ncbi:polycystin-1-like protein 2 isoform X2 [Cherax quadricarinatus]
MDWVVQLTYNKTGNYTLLGNASNALNWVNYSSFIHVVPVVSNNWTATPLCPCLGVKEGFNISINLTAAPNPPFSASIYATYISGSLFPNETMDFGTSSGGGVARALNEIFHTIILQPGNYTLTFFLMNEVSNTTFNTTVLVEDGLANVTFATRILLNGVMSPGFGDDQNIFMYNTSIYLLPSALKGLPSVLKWRVLLYSSDEVLNTTATANDSLSCMFSKGGDYDLVVEGYNTVQGWVSSNIMTLTVVMDISGFELSDDGRIIGPNVVKVVNASFTVLPPMSCIVIDYGDNSTEESFGYKDMCVNKFNNTNYIGPSSNPLLVNHTYTAEGIYQVRGLAVDLRYSFNTQLQVVIANLPCNMPDVQIVNKAPLFTQPETNWKSMPFVKSTKAKIECNKTVPVSRWWSILQVNSTTGEPQMDVVVENILPSWNYSQLQIPPLFLDLGVYKLSYWIRLNASKVFPLQRADYTYLQVTPSPLRAVIMDGSVFSVSRGYGQSLVLSPQELSVDPDNPSDKNFTVKWWCRQIAPTMETYQMNSTTGMTAVYNLQSVPAPRAAQNLTKGGCFGVGAGSLQYNYGNMNLNTSSFYLHDATYEFMVWVTKDTRAANASVQVGVTLQIPPSIIIQCVDVSICYPYNGGILVNPSSRMALIGTCVSQCGKNLALQWMYMDMSGNPVNDTCNTCDPVTNPVFLTPVTTFTIAANPLFFEINPSINKFRFRLTGTTETQSSGFAEMVVVLNGPPASGTCTLNTHSLRALIDSTMASCNNWKDQENLGIQSYTFYYPSGNTQATMGSSGFSSLNLIFPVGIFDVSCRITDNFGSFTNVFLGTVNASMITKAQYDAYNPSAVLQNLASIGDQTTLAMVLNSLASIKLNADWLSLNDSSFGNLTSDQANDRLNEISNMNKQALEFAADTMTFSSLSQLNVGVSVLKSASCGVLTQTRAAYTIDMNFRNKSLQFMKKMELALFNTTIYSPYDLQPFVSSFMDSAVCLLISMNEVIVNPSLSPPGDFAKAPFLDYDTGINKKDTSFVVPLNPADQMRQNILELTKQQAKSVVKDLFTLVDSLSTFILNLTVPGETVDDESESGAGMYVTKIQEQNLLGAGMEIRPAGTLNTSVNIPPNFCASHHSDILTSCTSDAGFTAVVWPVVTHVYPPSNVYLSNLTSVISLSVYSGSEYVTVANLTQPVILTIPRKSQTIPMPIFVEGNTAVDSRVPFVYHTFNVSNADSAFTVEISPRGDTLPDLVILLDYGRLPTPARYDTIISVKNLTVNKNGTYTWFVNNIQNNNRTGRLFLAIAILKKNSVIPKPETNDTLQKEDFVDFDINYDIRVTTSGCYFYNETSDMWSASGLKCLSANTTHVVCEAYHLTSFGSGYLPTPNTINFEYIFAHAGFINNLIIYVVIIITFVFYIIMMIWARFMDKKDVQYRGVTALGDNSVEDKYLYEITFTTGADKEAGTDSNIQFILSGEYSETDVRHLPPSDNRRYRRYSVDAFVMSTHGPLGDICYLRIWHDNSGKSPHDSWQLQTVVIRDLQTRDKFVFKVNSWLSLDRGENKLDILLKPSDIDTNEEFSTEFYNRGHRTANEDHMWLSIFLRPTGSRFSRKERVSVVMLYLYLSMLLNAFCYQRLPDSPRSGVFEFSALTISLQQTVIGIVAGTLVYPVTLLLGFIFKRARPLRLKKCRALEALAKQRRDQQNATETQIDTGEILNEYDVMSLQSSNNRSKDVSPVTCIPCWLRWLAWLLILGGLGISVFFVWSYAIMWGEIKTVKWFSSFITSFFISLLVTQWLKVVFVSTLGALCCKSANTLTEDIDCDEELPELNYDEEWKNVNPMDPSIKRKALNIGGVNSSEPEVVSLTTRLTKKREMNEVVRDIGIYCLFLVVLYVLVNGSTDPNAFLQQNSLVNSFITSGDNTLDYSQEVTTTDKYWYWVQNVLLQNLRAQRWYNDDPPYGLRGFLDDRVNRIIGYAIIRQIRSDPRTCRVAYSMRNFVRNCSGSRAYGTEDTRNFCNGWSVEEKVPGTCTYDQFRYKTETELQTYSTRGLLGTYGGGGYVIQLDNLETEDIAQLQTMQSLGWIDKYTRAVMLEFSTYNVNVNLFTICRIVAEFNEGGGVYTSWRFDPIQLLSTGGSFGFILSVCQIIFVATTVMSTLWQVWKIKKMKCEYFASYWHIAEICIILTSYATIAIYIYQYFLIRDALAIFNSTFGNGYVRMDAAALYSQVYLYSLAIIVFFSTLKLIKLLQFNKRIDQLALAIENCWNELATFFIAFGIVFFAFCCLFHFIFMGCLEDYSRLVTAVESTFAMLLGKLDLSEMVQVNPIAPILYFAFSVMNTIVLVNIMLTIIMVTFTLTKSDFESRENKYDIINFIWSRVRQNLRLEREPDASVIPNVQDESQNSATSDDSIADELPDKVSQLMKYISDVYFDGQLNLNDPEAVKQIVQGRLPSNSLQSYTRKFQNAGQKSVPSSD